MRLKEIAELLNAAQTDIEEWVEYAREIGNTNEEAIDDSISLANELGEAATFIEGELL